MINAERITTLKTSTLAAVPFTRVSLTDGFWAPRQTVNRDVTLPVEYKQCKETGRIDAFKLDWKPGMPNQLHRVWDSDIGKWIEAVAYSLKTHPAIGLVFWAHRMLQLTGEGDFADVMERALYNGCLSGVSLDGRKFFYANPLAVYPEAVRDAQGHVAGARQEWFGCACCPPNIARLIASVGEYFYSESGSTAWVHLYAQGDSTLHVAGQTVGLKVATKYPWDGAVSLRLIPERAAKFTLALRIPGWCSKYTLTVNGNL